MESHSEITDTELREALAARPVLSSIVEMQRRA